MRSMLPPLLLLLIYEQPDHGYDLIERLVQLGVTDVEHGHVYRVLRNLEREHSVVSDWVTSNTGPARRRYELTESGLAALDVWMSQLAQLDHVVDACLARWAGAAGSAITARPGQRAAHLREGSPPVIDSRPVTSRRTHPAL